MACASNAVTSFSAAPPFLGLDEKLTHGELQSGLLADVRARSMLHHVVSLSFARG